MRRHFALCLVFIFSLICLSSTALASSFGFGQSATIEAGTVFDEKGVRIDVVGLDYSGSGTTLSANVFNGTSTEINVLGGAVGYSVYSINGYMVSGGYVNEDIPANESALVTMRFDDMTLKMLGIEEIASIEFGFLIEDENDNEMATGPIKLLTSAHDGHDYTVNTYREYVTGSSFEKDMNAERISFTEEIIAEGEGVAIPSWGVFENTNGDLILMIEAVNSGSCEANLHGTDFCINGLKVYSGSVCYENMNPGTTAICTLNLTNMLDENLASMFDIEEIDNVSFTAQVYGDNYAEIIPPFQMFFPVNSEEKNFNTEGEELYNANGVRVVYKTIYDAASEYDDNIYAMFLVENNTGVDIDLRAENVYLNGEKVAANFFGGVADGYSSAVELILYSYSFEDYNIVTAGDIESMSIDFKIRDTDYNAIDVFTVEVPLAKNGSSNPEVDEPVSTIEPAETTESTAAPEDTTASVETSTDTSANSEEGTFTYLHDKWDLYKATLVSDNLVKIDGWYRFNAKEETPFKLDHSVVVIRTDDGSTDFTWLNESHTAFSVTMQDQKNTRFEEPTLVVFELGDVMSGDTANSDRATYTYLHDKWDLYRATRVSDNLVRIDNWYRVKANDETPFRLDHCVIVIRTDDGSTDFAWIDDSYSSFCVTMQDMENSRFEEPTLVIFELEE